MAASALSKVLLCSGALFLILFFLARNYDLQGVADADHPLSFTGSQVNDSVKALVDLWSKFVESEHLQSSFPSPHLEDCKRCGQQQMILDSRGEDGKDPPWILHDIDRDHGGDFYVPWIEGGDKENLPLTKRVQRDIWLNQHPKNCNNAKFLLGHWHSERTRDSIGIGSELISTAAMLGAAVHQGRVLVTTPYHGARHEGCTGPNHARWSCYFIPEASKECIERAMSEPEKNWGPDGVVKQYEGGPPWEDIPSLWGEPWNFMQKNVQLNGELMKNYPRERLRWWRAQALRYLMRYPSKYLCDLLNKARHEAFGDVAAELLVNQLPVHIPLMNQNLTEIEKLVWSDYGPWMPRPMVSVHVRQGDKKREMLIHSFKDYMDLAIILRRRFPHVRDIWLSTEMQSVVDETKGYPEWNFYFTNITRQVGETPMADYMKMLGKRKTFDSGFVNLMMGSQADFFVGPLGSTWSYILDGMRMTGGKMMAGFLTVNEFNMYL